MGPRSNLVDCIIIGAGISGISAGKRLVEAGLSVCILEKSRGFGGRLATRRIDGESFDHGAQFFTTRNKEFARAVQGWVEQGIARHWFGEPGRSRFIVKSGMSSLVKQLAVGLDVRREQKVEQIRFDQGRWVVRSQSALFEGRRLLMTSPAPQALELLAGVNAFKTTRFREILGTIGYEKCISLMGILEEPLGLSSYGFSQLDICEPIATITETDVKGTTDRPGLVIQSGPIFAEENFHETPEGIADRLLEVFPWSETPALEGMSVQKWRFAKRKEHGLTIPFLQDEYLPLWHAGDGYLAPKVEGAFLSGIRAADAIAQRFETTGIDDSGNPQER